MVAKSCNLCLSADVDTASELLSLADSVGPSIVVLKTHYDIVRGWNHNRRTGTGVQLATLARKHGFLIFEDRKFGDIGSTVQKQYVGGEAAIIEWAHMTNLNMIPGPAVVTALSQAAKSWRERKRYEVKTDITAGKRSDRGRKHSDHSTFNESDEDEVPGSPKSLTGSISHAGRKASIVSITTISQNFESANAQQISDATAFPLMGEAPLERGLLILAQMSSAGNLMTPAYTKACLAAARDHKEVVMGFISQETLNSEPNDDFITMTPGCQLPPPDEDADGYDDDSDEDSDEETQVKGDGLGQQYNTPRRLIGLGCDIVIVGRGIIKAEDPVTEAERYRKKAWRAYLHRVGGLVVKK